jgi:hypothetical protein
LLSAKQLQFAVVAFKRNGMGRLDDAVRAADAAAANQKQAEAEYWRQCEEFARSEMLRLIFDWSTRMGIALSQPQIKFTPMHTADDYGWSTTVQTSVAATFSSEGIPMDALAFIEDTDGAAPFRVDRIYGWITAQTFAALGELVKSYRERQAQEASAAAAPRKRRRRPGVGPMGMGSKGWD